VKRANSGKSLREAIRKSGYRPYTVARMANVDTGNMAKFMAGKIGYTFDTAERIWAMLGYKLVKVRKLKETT
jgi:hypothetical protein